MKSIQAEIQKRFPKVAEWKQSVLKLINHPLLASFREENPDIPLESYERKWGELAQYIEDQKKCQSCQGLETCSTTLIPGYRFNIGKHLNSISVYVEKCPHLVAYEEAKKREKLMKTHKVPKDILSATFQTIDIDEDRVQVIEEIMSYADQFKNGIPRYGYYLYGNFGVGKSHIVAALANQLKMIGIDSFMVYVPAFVQEVYNTFKDGRTHELIEAVKQVKVLILDDIGAENLNPYIRDEVIGNILQHRIGEGLPTLYTSNFALDELQEHLSYTAKGGLEKIKGARIMERIRHYVKPLEVKGRNRRGDINWQA